MPLLAFTFFGLLAQPVAAQPPLTLDAAVREALEQNRTLVAARSTVTEADLHTREARAGRLPRITVAETWQRGNQPVFVFSSLLAARQFAAANFAIDALNHPDPIGYFHTAVGVEQVLYDGGRTRAQIRGAGLQRDIAATAADETEAAIRLGVTQTYGQLVALASGRRALAAALATAQDDLTRARQRRDAGLVTEADVLSLAVHVSDLQQRAIQADGEFAIARAELNRQTGAPIDRAFEVADVVPATVATPAAADVARLLATADQQRPELRRAALAETLADTFRQQARAALIPQVGAQAGLDIAGTRFADRASSWVVGGELRWTFSTGGAERARVRAATEAAARTHLEREDVRAQVQVDVLTAVRRLDAARARADVGRAAVDQARESQRIIRDRFDAGMAGVTDVLRASAALLDAEAQRTAALVDTLVSQALLDKATATAR